MPLVRDQQPSRGCLRAALRASQSDRNNIFNSYKVLTEIELFKPLAKGGGSIMGLA